MDIFRKYPEMNRIWDKYAPTIRWGVTTTASATVDNTAGLTYEKLVEAQAVLSNNSVFEQPHVSYADWRQQIRETYGLTGVSIPERIQKISQEINDQRNQRLSVQGLAYSSPATYTFTSKIYDKYAKS